DDRDPCCPLDQSGPCDSPAEDCIDGAFCSVAVDPPGSGTCKIDVGSDCRTDADCGGFAACVPAGRITQSAASPVAPSVGTSAVLTSAGRCRDAAGRALGQCLRDADCIAGAGCRLEPIVASAPDTDGDELPDPFDNCPSHPNVLQEDADGDGVGNACDAE